MTPKKEPVSEDLKLKRRIELALQGDLNLSGYDINVRVVGGTVTLQGIVDVLADKHHAHRVTASVDGVGEIENGLTVSTDGQIVDRAVYEEIQQELAGNPHLNDIQVKVSVRKGEVTLTGTVKNAAQKQAVQETVSKARGVKKINDNLTVSTREQTDGAEIVNEVQRSMAEAGIGANIKVSAAKGVITLAGTSGIEERNRAVKVASRVPGVRKVTAHLIDTDQSELSRSARAAAAVKAAFAADPAAGSMPVQIYEKEGHLVLEGAVMNVEQKERVDDVLHQLMEEFGPDFTVVENKIFIR